jgi:hypothetical protein
MLKLEPAIAIEPVLEVVSLFAATVKFTVLLPVRLLAPMTVIQLLLLVTVHVHPLPVVTTVLPLPPPAATF